MSAPNEGGRYWDRTSDFCRVKAEQTNSPTWRFAEKATAGLSYWVLAASGTGSRGIGDPSDESGWLAKRDPDGSIRADLERLNQLEDGIIANVDSAQLLALRLTEAGFEATVDEYPGGHTTLDKLPEILGYLKAAASK